jgi:hypothetical protein
MSKKQLLIFAIISGIFVISIYTLITKFDTIKNFLTTSQNTTSIDDDQKQPSAPITPYAVISDKGVEFVIYSPLDTNAVTCPFVLTGKVPGNWFFEAEFQVRIISRTGEEITSSIASAYGDWMTEEYVDFSAEIFCPECKGNAIVILQKNNPSDLEQNDDVATFDIKFADSCTEDDGSNTANVNIYFNNFGNDTDCIEVFPLFRTVPKTNTINYTLQELLKGPSSLELSGGYSTSIPQDVFINSINIENKIAYVDFDSKLQNEVGGSCRVSAIRSQITKTLLQFDNIDEVIISIDGRSEDILQP